MILEILLEQGLIERKSDCGKQIRNKQTNGIYDIAIDLTNEKREELGLEPYEYEEVEMVEENGIQDR